MKKRRFLAVIIVILIAALLSGATQAATTYPILILGTLPGDNTSYSRGINNLGQVMGISYRGSFGSSFLWEDGVWTNLSLLEGHPWAIDINDLGQVVGAGQPNLGYARAFLWEAGAITYLDTPGVSHSFAWALNNLGQIVGHGIIGQTVGKALMWEDGVMTVLDTISGQFPIPRDINNLGQVVGTTDLAFGQGRAFLWEDGVMSDLGTLGGSWSDAFGINDLGQVIGTSEDSLGNQRAFLWEDGVMSDLGTLGGQWSQANGVNNLGQVVGTSQTDLSVPHAFLWEDGVMTDLGALDTGWSKSEAYGINDQGQVAGAVVVDHFNTWRACIWTVPVTPPTPEEQVDAIITEVERLVSAGSLNQGQGNALYSKLNNVLVFLGKGKLTAACNLLRAFNNQVQSFIDDGILTPEEGQALIDAVNDVRIQTCQ